MLRAALKHHGLAETVEVRQFVSFANTMSEAREMLSVLYQSDPVKVSHVGRHPHIEMQLTQPVGDTPLPKQQRLCAMLMCTIGLIGVGATNG